jgi:hypothetical protein
MGFPGTLVPAATALSQVIAQSIGVMSAPVCGHVKTPFSLPYKAMILLSNLAVEAPYLPDSSWLMVVFDRPSSLATWA